MFRLLSGRLTPRVGLALERSRSGIVASSVHKGFSKRSFHTTQSVFCSTVDKASTSSKKFSWKDFKKYVALAYPERYILGGALFCLGINAVCNLLMPYGMGKSIDSAVMGEGDGEKQEEARSYLYKVAGALLAGLY